MASKTDLYNRALQKLGVKAISSDTENSNARRACDRCYDFIRRAALEKHRWNFAIKRAVLAADAVGPIHTRQNSFTLPANALKLLPPDPESDSPWRDWIIEGKSVVTNDSAPLNVRYVSDVIVINDMSALFQEYVAAMMGFEMCEELTQSNSKKESCREDAKQAIAEAKKSNGIQNVPQQSVEDIWIAVRNT